MNHSRPERTPLQLRQLELLRDRHNPRAATELLQSVESAVKDFARRFKLISKIDQDDLESEARIAVLEAISDFDETRGTVFFTVVYDRINWHLLRYTKDHRSLIRVPIPAFEKGKRPPPISSLNIKANRDVDDGIELIDKVASDDPMASELSIRADNIALARRALATLKDRDRDILMRRADDQTLEEIGQHYGLSRERIRQLEELALEKFEDHVLRSSRRRRIKPGAARIPSAVAAPEQVTATIIAPRRNAAPRPRPRDSDHIAIQRYHDAASVEPVTNRQKTWAERAFG